MENSYLTTDNICVYKSQLQQKEQGYSHIINDYTKLDPTLPRTKMIKCPNENCTQKEEENTEVIYIRYDDTNMKYIYLCSECNTVWKINE